MSFPTPWNQEDDFRYQTLVQDDHSELLLLRPSPSPHPFISEDDVPLADSLYPQCLKNVERIFLKWDGLSWRCKESLYVLDDRWDDRAIRFELESMSRNCRTPAVFDGTLNMHSDLEEILKTNDVCTIDILERLIVIREQMANALDRLARHMNQLMTTLTF